MTPVDLEAISHYEQLLARFPAGEEPPLLIVIGLGGGHVLDALERRAAPTRVLAIEPIAAAVAPMFARRDWSDWTSSGRLTLLMGPDYRGAADAWRLVDRRALNPPMLVTPALEQQFAAPVKSAKVVAAQIVLGAQANDAARREFAGRYLLNTIANLPVIAAEGDVATLAGRFTGVPAFVIGAGPSLDRNVAELARVQDRGLVVCVDTAVRPLLAAGIRPHLVVGVDPSVANARHLTDLPEMPGTWLVAEGSLDPRVFPTFAGRTFTFRVSDHHPWPWLAECESDRGRLDAWGSVLTTAFDLAYRLGCGPIIFAGADLAYTDGLLHCRNTVYEPEWRHLTTTAERAAAGAAFIGAQETSLQPDVRGKTVVSAPRFIQFRDWLVSRSVAAADRQIVNTSGRGILHGGRITQLKLQQIALPAPAAPDLRARLASAWDASAEHRQRAERPLADAVTRGGDRLPIEPWLDFAGDTASPDQILCAVEAAAPALKRQAAKSDYLTMQREYYDTRAVSLQKAQALVHADYGYASLQAQAHQAHVLLDFIQRSYGIEAGAPLQNVLQSARETQREIRILDFGCGVGRSMQPLAEAGFRVDGADISERMIDFARGNPRLAQSEFFLSRGSDCGGAPEASYDLIYSQLCLQHICSRTIRNELLRAFAKALRPGGVLLVQMHFYPDRAADTVPAPHAPWSADAYDATGTNGEADVWATPDEMHLVYADFARHFQDLRLQFVDFPRETSLHTVGDDTWFSHLIVSGSRGYTLGARIYAPLVNPNPAAEAVE
jgi:SAM-dependent methyltransferase